MLVPANCLYCADVCSSETFRHCHMLLYHTFDYVFSDAYQTFILARDGKPCEGLDEYNKGSPVPAFIAVFDAKFGKSEHDGHVKCPPPQKNTGARLVPTIQTHHLSDDAVQQRSTGPPIEAMAVEATESVSHSPCLPLDHRSTVLMTPSPSPPDCPATGGRFLHAAQTSPLPLNWSPQIAEQSSKSDQLAEQFSESPHIPVKLSDTPAKEKRVHQPVTVQSEDSHCLPSANTLVNENSSCDRTITPLTPSQSTACDSRPRDPRRPLVVEQENTRAASAGTMSVVPLSTENEVAESPKKIVVKCEPTASSRTGISSQKIGSEDCEVIYLSESDDEEIAEFELTDQVIDDVEVVCHSSLNTQIEKSTPAIHSATDLPPMPTATTTVPAPLQNDCVLSNAENLKIVFSLASVDAFRKVVVSALEAHASTDQQTRQPGGKIRVGRADRTFDCSIESNNAKRSRPYDRARELVKKSISNRGNSQSQRTPVKRTDGGPRFKSVRPRCMEQQFRVYMSSQTDDFLRYSTCKSTKVVRQFGISVLCVARSDEAPRFLSNRLRCQEPKFSMRDEHIVRVEQLSNFDTRRRIANSYDWRLRHMQVSRERQAECLLQNLLHLRVKMSICKDCVSPHSNLMSGTPKKLTKPDLKTNAFARAAIASVELRAKRSHCASSVPTVSALGPPYRPSEPSSSRLTSDSTRHRSSRRMSPSRSPSRKPRPQRSPSPVLRSGFKRRLGPKYSRSRSPSPVLGSSLTSRLGPKRARSRSPPRQPMPRFQPPPWANVPPLPNHRMIPNVEYYSAQQTHSLAPPYYTPMSFTPMINTNQLRFRKF